jgi:arginase
VHEPVPFGLTIAQLTSAIRAAVTSLPLAGAAICEFAPADSSVAADDLPTVLRILAALTSGPAA